VKPLVNGIQQHVMSITKHYIMNNQETDRSGVNEIIDEQTLMELYSPAFGAAASNVDVHGLPSTQGTSGYMCAYNRINGEWACEQPLTLKNVLKTWYNFSGFVVSAPVNWNLR
jgi:beta-glucosidase